MRYDFGVACATGDSAELPDCELIKMFEVLDDGTVLFENPDAYVSALAWADIVGEDGVPFVWHDGETMGESCITSESVIQWALDDVLEFVEIPEEL